jgi:hypothetical protein
MVVALAALVIASSGTAIAASLVNGDSLIKKHSLSGNRLKNHTLTGTQINLHKLGKVPSAKNADHATTAATATSAVTANSAFTANSALSAASAGSASSAGTAANLSGLTRFRTTIASAGTTPATGANVTLATVGPLTLVGNCYVATGNTTTAALNLSTTAAAHYDAYNNQFSGAPLVPGTPQDVAETDATATPPAIGFEGPADGTFAAITDTGSSYLTGLASVAVNLNGGTGCTFAGYVSAS